MGSPPPARAWVAQCGRTAGSLALLIGLDIALREAFQAMHADFPSAFAGMLLLVCVLMITTPRSRPDEDGKTMEDRPSVLYAPLKPGKDILVRFLPCFFLSDIITLPRNQAHLRPLDLVKLLAVAIVGFELTLYSTAKCTLLLDHWHWPSACRGACPLSLPGDSRAGGSRASPDGPQVETADEEIGAGPVEQAGREGGGGVEVQAVASVAEASGSGPEAGPGVANAEIDDDDDELDDDPPPPPLQLRVSRTISYLPPPPPFSARLHLGLGLVALVSGVASVLVFRLRGGTFDEETSPWMLPQTLFTTTLTVFCYVTGARAPPRFRKAINPIISGCALALLGIYLYALAVGQTLDRQLAAYLVGRNPLDIDPGVPYRWVGGGGDLLFGCLQPSVLALGISVYENRRCLCENRGVILATLAFATLFSLLSSVAFSRALVLPRRLGAATLARNITAPLAVMIANMLGTDVAVTLLCVFASSLYGVAWGTSHLRWYGMDKDFVAKGLATGVSCHGLGTASLVNEPEAMAFSAVAFLVCGIMTVLLFTIPPARDFFYQIS